MDCSQFVELQSLEPSEQKRIIAECMSSDLYQKGARQARFLGRAYLIVSVAAVLAFLLHQYVVARVFLFAFIVLAMIRLFKKYKQVKLLKLMVKLYAREIGLEKPPASA